MYSYTISQTMVLDSDSEDDEEDDIGDEKEMAFNR